MFFIKCVTYDAEKEGARQARPGLSKCILSKPQTTLKL